MIKKRVPTILQLESLECGAACLAMILAYYNKWVSLEQLRADCCVSRNGVSADKILTAASKYGLNCKGYKINSNKLKNIGKHPCIVHWNYHHFVVINYFKKNKVSITDPSNGHRLITIDEFEDSYSGTCLILFPSNEFIPNGKKRSIIKFIAKRLTGSTASILFLTLLGLIVGITSLITPIMDQLFIDRILTNTDNQILSIFSIIVLTTILLQVVSLLLNSNYSTKIAGKMATTGNASFVWKILHLPLDFFSMRMSGDLLVRQKMNDSISKTIVNALAPILINTIMTIFYFWTMIKYNIMLSMVGILAVILNTILSLYVSDKRKTIIRSQFVQESKFMGATAAGIDCIETIKSNGAENGYFSLWAGYQANVIESDVKFHKFNQKAIQLPNFFINIINISILVFGVMLCMNGQFTIGSILAFQGLVQGFMSPTNGLITSGQSLIEMRAQMERVDDVMESKIDINFSTKQNKSSKNKLSGKIDINNLNFAFNNNDSPFIKDLNISIAPGESIAFVGSTGSGKSTLSKLLCGLYEATDGEILFDNTNIQNINRDIFTSSVALVSQEVAIFEGTFEENIKFWDKTIEDYEMILAANDAQMHKDILNRKGGYKYKITQGGKNLSGGERQRLEIARVLAADPSIIIFDEATSALDAKVESKVIQSIKNKGITTIFIAHRLSTIRDCDRIFVLDNGKVVEQGTHNFLLSKNSYYSKLIRSE